MWNFLILAKQKIGSNKPAAYLFILFIRLDRLLLSVTLDRDTACATLFTQLLAGKRSVLEIMIY
jgi:hypothetical protein